MPRSSVVTWWGHLISLCVRQTQCLPNFHAHHLFQVLIAPEYFRPFKLTHKHRVSQVSWQRFTTYENIPLVLLSILCKSWQWGKAAHFWTPKAFKQHQWTHYPCRHVQSIIIPIVNTRYVPSRGTPFLPRVHPPICRLWRFEWVLHEVCNRSTPLHPFHNNMCAIRASKFSIKLNYLRVFLPPPVVNRSAISRIYKRFLHHIHVSYPNRHLELIVLPQQNGDYRRIL